MMIDLCSLLVGLCIVITLVTVVGHGLWVFFATIWGALRGEVPTQAPPPRHRPRAVVSARRILECLRCGEPVPAGSTDCPRCGLDLEGLVAGELTDLEAVARQLERFRRSRAMPDHQLDE